MLLSRLAFLTESWKFIVTHRTRTVRNQQNFPAQPETESLPMCDTPTLAAVSGWLNYNPALSRCYLFWLTPNKTKILLTTWINDPMENLSKTMDVPCEGLCKGVVHCSRYLCGTGWVDSQTWLLDPCTTKDSLSSKPQYWQSTKHIIACVVCGGCMNFVKGYGPRIKLSSSCFAFPKNSNCSKVPRLSQENDAVSVKLRLALPLSHTAGLTIEIHSQRQVIQSLQIGAERNASHLLECFRRLKIPC